MREILFRGKRTDTGEWVEGYYEFGYSSDNEEPTHYMWGLNHSEKYGEMFIVIPETVGQYTGLNANGKKIFEGDIVKCRHYWELKRYPLIDVDEETYFFMQKIRGAYGKHKTERSGFSNDYFYYRNYAVEYYEKKGEYRVRNGSCFNSLTQSFIFGHDIEIIGNIHDNPELMKEAE